eukprot:7673379-Pyramimonas_sp.AAC.1
MHFCRRPSAEGTGGPGVVSRPSCESLPSVSSTPDAVECRKTLRPPQPWPPSIRALCRLLGVWPSATPSALPPRRPPCRACSWSARQCCAAPRAGWRRLSGAARWISRHVIGSNASHNPTDRRQMLT